MWVVMALVIYFWPWVLGAAAVILLGLWIHSLANLARAAAAERRDQRAAIIARADQQHQWVLAGDNRGVYGEHPPAV
jgi:hypothetical protein